MFVRGVLLGVLLVACSDTPSTNGDGGTGGPDAQVPCTKGALTLAATTLAGCEQRGDVDGDRTTARFDNPTNVEIAADGTAIVADFDNNLLRRIAPDGATTTLVRRDDFLRPFGLAFAADGTLYVETDDNDAGAHSTETGTIWRVDAATGEATVIARDLGRPRGLAVLPDGRLAMADHMHHVVSILDPATATETILAGVQDTAGYANGTGAEALFAQPYDLVLLPDGDLAVTDQDNHRIRRVTLAGVVTDLAGSGELGSIDGPVAVAAFHAPQALALAPDGSLYVTDVKRFVIRRIADGAVTTVVGDGTQGWIDSADPRGARFYGLEGLAVDAERLLIADGNGGDGSTFHRVRVVMRGALP